ncbi:MAG: chromate transporter [Paludibacteraceae bacterium]|nr:chromate transporter [Paludibacteraceae bacterium]
MPWRLFLTYLKIGTFTIGGGYVMLALIQREVVDKHKWLDEKEFLNMIALAQAAPGVIAVNSAIFIAWRVSRNEAHRHQRLYSALCVMCAVLGAVLPSIVIILLIAMYFTQFKSLPVLESIFKGIRPAVVALIAATVIRLARKI